MTAKDEIAAEKAAMHANIAKAIAWLSRGLYVITAAHSSAMVASWVCHRCDLGASERVNASRPCTAMGKEEARGVIGLPYRRH